MSTDVIIVFVILFAAVIMFSIEKVRNDVASIIIMLSLAWSGVITLDQAFSGILGGTITMVASGPLIILNDLLAEGGYESFGMFSVTPFGISLLIAGILYFHFFSKVDLPGGEEENHLRKDELLDIYNLPKKSPEIQSFSALSH